MAETSPVRWGLGIRPYWSMTMELCSTLLALYLHPRQLEHPTQSTIRLQIVLGLILLRWLILKMRLTVKLISNRFNIMQYQM